MISHSRTAATIPALIEQLNSGQLALAEQSAKALLKKQPASFIVHHVLALALDGQQKFAEAALSYAQAIKLESRHADLHFNLGIVLAHLNRWQEAAGAYQKAIALKPDFFEAYGNLGTVLQRQGLLKEAITQYRQGLRINPQDARAYFNLGTALRDSGELKEAIASYQQAIALFANYTDAYNNLGETLRDDGDMAAAVKQYQAALALNPMHPHANYNMGEFLSLSKQYEAAAQHFARSQLDDWQARQLFCLYKGQQFTSFKTQLDAVVNSSRHTAPFISTLATHYAINFDSQNTYNFCKNALDFVYRNSITALAEPNSPLLSALLRDIHQAEIATRVQGMLSHGKQSAGNLFKRTEASFRELSALIQQEFVRYKTHYAGADCELIRAFPETLEFTSSWYVYMQQGGHLKAHIHEIGWISGAVYLAMPTPNGMEGAFEYGTHGDDYPIAPDKSLDDFPTAQILPRVGDIVLFPSSLFHRTIPFSADEARICIAFDLKPSANFA